MSVAKSIKIDITQRCRIFNAICSIEEDPKKHEEKMLSIFTNFMDQTEFKYLPSGISRFGFTVVLFSFASYFFYMEAGSETLDTMKARTLEFYKSKHFKGVLKHDDYKEIALKPTSLDDKNQETSNKRTCLAYIQLKGFDEIEQFAYN